MSFFTPVTINITFIHVTRASSRALYFFFFKESRVPFSYLVACWRFRREEGGRERDGNEKRDREEEERVRPRALNVNLGNQIKAVSFFLSRGVDGDASERRKIRKRDGGRRREEEGFPTGRIKDNIRHVRAKGAYAAHVPAGGKALALSVC